MAIEIREEPVTALAEHAKIPMSFEVRSLLEVQLVDGGLGGVALVERPVATPWTKNYDHGWVTWFDLRNWGLVSAWDGGTRIGGAVMAFDTPGLIMLAGRRDLAVVWDLRVAPPRRRTGVGSMLFRAAEAWARARGCVRLDVETQNVNHPACRLYARMGCVLRAIDRFAYPDLPGEAELLWTKQLAG
jgi:GNAT superfamily N-acetyltransferase